MKTIKKLVFGLFALVLLTTVLLSLKQVAYAAYSEQQVENAQVYFINSKTLRLTMAGGQSVDFVSNRDINNNVNSYRTDENKFCNPPKGQSEPDFNILFARFNNSSDPTSGSIGPEPASHIWAGPNDPNCKSTLPKDREINFSKGPTAVFTDKTVTTIRGDDFSFQDGANLVMKFGGKTIAFYDKNPEDNELVFRPKNSADKSYFCKDTKVTSKTLTMSTNPLPAEIQVGYINTSDGKCNDKTYTRGISIPNLDGNAARIFLWNGTKIETVTGTLSLSRLPGTEPIYVKDARTECGGDWALKLDKAGGTSGTLFRLKEGSVDKNDKKYGGDAGFPDCTLTARRDVLLANEAGAEVEATANGAASCEANAGFDLGWIICPVFTIADGIATQLIDLFKNLLSFRIEPGSDYEKSVKPAWTTIKNIVSALVVIVMLIMIFSQAISIGPFDAYTLRKLLPRIVAAVILIQLSWTLFAWVINLVDDIGRGLMSLLDIAFARSTDVDINDFWQLLDNAGIGDARAGAVTWLVILPLLVISAVVALPMVLLGLLTAVIALLTGIALLIFRNVLILALLILTPLAILAWVLPGTERYWKMWWENFYKVLFMFPLIILIIEAGRIFAYVAGPAANATDKTHLLAFLMIIIGYFGPLFILPKTFRWGGQLMQVASNSVFGATGRVTSKEGFAGKYFRNRQEGLKNERLRQSQERYSQGVGFNARRPWRRPLDLMRSGQVDPLLWGRRREQAMTGYSAKGAESEEADVKASDAKAKLKFDQTDQHDALARAMAEGNENFEYETHEDAAYNRAHGLTGANRQLTRLGSLSESDMHAGLNAVAKYGGSTNFRYLDDRVDRLRNGSADDRAVAKKFLDANAQTLLPKMKHLYYGNERNSAVDSMIDSLSENSFVGMEGAEMEAILESLTQRLAANPTDPAALSRLSRVMTFYQSAINNGNIQPNISSGVNQAVEAFVDGQNAGSINTGRSNLPGLNGAGRPGINHAVAANPQIAHEVANISGRIDINGNII